MYTVSCQSMQLFCILPLVTPIVLKNSRKCMEKPFRINNLETAYCVYAATDWSFFIS